MDQGSSSGGQGPRFRVETDPGDPRVVRLHGEVDVYTSPELKELLDSVVLGDAAGETIVIDLSGLDFIDSTGLGVLVGALKRARAGGGDVTLRGPQPSILKVLEITGLVTLFTIEA